MKPSQPPIVINVLSNDISDDTIVAMTRTGFERKLSTLTMRQYRYLLNSIMRNDEMRKKVVDRQAYYYKNINSVDARLEEPDFGYKIFDLYYPTSEPDDRKIMIAQIRNNLEARVFLDSTSAEERNYIGTFTINEIVL